MNYEQMNDWQINKAVAEKLGGYRNETPKILSAEVGFNEYVGDGQFLRTTRDYCNNPADAWPIIADSKISIMWVGGYWDSVSPLSAKSASAHSIDNPLRAAMIAYLMMQESA